MSSIDYDVCKEITDSEAKILGAGIIENRQLVAMYAKRNVPLPEEEKFRLMISKSEIFVSMAKSNEDFFGRFRYLVSSFETSDILFFRLARGTSGRARTLVIQILRPYDMTEVVKELMRRLRVE